MPADRNPSKLLPLPQSAFYILLALVDGERHGYSITKEVLRTTDGEIRLSSGTLYRQLHQMATDGWINEKIGNEDALGRRTYGLTPWGLKIARAEARRLESLVEFARNRRLLPLHG